MIRIFCYSLQAINSVGDQTLLLGEEGEKLRWFLLPSEAAQLFSGKTPLHFPMTAPFRPLQWKNNSPFSEGTNLTGAGYMEPSDVTSVSPTEKCSSNLSEKAMASRRNVKGSEAVSKITDCSCVVNGQIGDRNVSDFISNAEKCDKCQGRDLSATQGINKTPLPNTAVKSLGDDKCSSANLDADNVDGRHRNEEPWNKGSPDGIFLEETDVCGFSGDEKEIKTRITVGEEFSSNGHHMEPSSPVDNETAGKSSKTVDRSSSTSTSPEEMAVAGDSDSVTNSEAACKRKPRTKKKNEVNPGKPQFHHPPKSIFKPTVQVRKPCLKCYNVILRSVCCKFLYVSAWRICCCMGTKLRFGGAVV